MLNNLFSSSFYYNPKSISVKPDVDVLNSLINLFSEKSSGFVNCQSSSDNRGNHSDNCQNHSDNRGNRSDNCQNRSDNRKNHFNSKLNTNTNRITYIISIN